MYTTLHSAKSLSINLPTTFSISHAFSTRLNTMFSPKKTRKTRQTIPKHVYTTLHCAHHSLLTYQQLFPFHAPSARSAAWRPSWKTHRARAQTPQCDRTARASAPLSVRRLCSTSAAVGRKKKNLKSVDALGRKRNFFQFFWWKWSGEWEWVNHSRFGGCTVHIKWFSEKKKTIEIRLNEICWLKKNFKNIYISR